MERSNGGREGGREGQVKSGLAYCTVVQQGSLKWAERNGW